MLIGANVSRAGGLLAPLERAREMDISAIQFFLSSPRAWAMSEVVQAEAKAFRERRLELGVSHVVIHASYLINLASADPIIYEKSRTALGLTMSGAAAIGADGVVLHPGSHRGLGLDAILSNWTRGVKEACRGGEVGVPLWLENTAGAGGTMGETFEELALLRDALCESVPVGFCLDTQHLFAAGWDLRDQSTRLKCQEAALAQLGTIDCVHLNDSLTTCGSHRDRHANIDSGEIGGENLLKFLTVIQGDVPAILEVPGDGSGPRTRDVAALRLLLSVVQ